MVWLEERGLPRWAGATVVLLAVVVTVGLVGWLVIPVLVEDVVKLAGNAPDYLDALGQRLTALTKNVPALHGKLDLSGRSVGDFLPPLGSIVTRVGRYTFTVLGVLVIGIVLLGIVVYLMFDPTPSYRAYLLFTPAAHQDRAQRAFIAGSQAAVGWVWSNVVVGAVEAVIVGLFLWLIGVPGAFVWGAFAFIAELVPVLGAYLMAIPPLLVALSIRPLLALWVLLFYLIFNPLKDHIAFPLVRRTTMQLNPVFLLFVTVAAAEAFGLIGALISAPLAGFIKAYYEEFYLGARQQDEVSQRVEEMVRLDQKSANPRTVTDRVSPSRARGYVIPGMDEHPQEEAARAGINAAGHPHQERDERPHASVRGLERPSPPVVRPGHLRGASLPSPRSARLLLLHF